MNVRELIERLREFNPDDLVVLSRDAEGNGHSTLEWVEEARFNDGEVGLRGLTPDAEKQGYTEEDVMDGDDCVTLYP